MIWIIAAEIGCMAAFALGSWIADAIERARWRRVAVVVFTRHPIASLPPPTELRLPGWFDTDDQA